MLTPSTEERLRIIEDTLIVMGHIENRQAKLLKGHSEIMTQIDERLNQASARDAIIDERIEKLVSATGALIANRTPLMSA